MMLTREECDVIVNILEVQDRNLLRQISRSRQSRSKVMLQDKEHVIGSLIQKFVAESKADAFTDLWW